MIQELLTGVGVVTIILLSLLAVWSFLYWYDERRRETQAFQERVDRLVEDVQQLKEALNAE